MNEPQSIHAAQDWGVVLQSVPSKHKKEIVKQLDKIFALDKRDAEKILSNVPLILVDNLPFGLAARIRKFFQTIGAVVETTNHEVIKKNCFQIVWPKTPDLSFFMKDETRPAEAPVQEKKRDARPVETPPPEKKIASLEKESEMPKIREAPLPSEPVQESPKRAPHYPRVSEEKPLPASLSGDDTGLERRVDELNGKLQKIHEEKQTVHAQHAEAIEKVKNEYHQRLEEEKKKSGEIAKAYEDLQKEVQKHESLIREGEAWRAKAAALDEKIRELETHLMQKTVAVDQLTHEKEDFARQSEKAALEIQHELSTLRSREQEFFRKIEGLERDVKKMTESLRFLDGVLAQFEKQISELADVTLPSEAEPGESPS